MSTIEESETKHRKARSMPKHIRKSLKGYMSKIKKETRNFQIPTPSKSFSTSRDWVLKRCRRPRTLSFSIHRVPRNHRPTVNQDNNDSDRDVSINREAATLSDVDRFLYENFRSLYINDDEDGRQENKKPDDGDDDSDDDDSDKDDDNDDDGEDTDDDDPEKNSLASIIFNSPRVLNHPPRLLDPAPRLHAPQRFFMRPATSGLLTNDRRRSMTSITTTTATSDTTASSSSGDAATNSEPAGRNEIISSGQRNAALPQDCIAVLRYTPNPCQDFKQSMMEVVESRMRTQRGSKVDWDFMEELLISYLDLNEKKSHKFVLSAFVDLVVTLRQNDDKKSKRSPAGSRRSRIAKDRIRGRMRRVAQQKSIGPVLN